jgi:hypothetical protein
MGFGVAAFDAGPSDRHTHPRSISATLRCRTRVGGKGVHDSCSTFARGCAWVLAPLHRSFVRNVSSFPRQIVLKRTPTLIRWEILWRDVVVFSPRTFHLAPSTSHLPPPTSQAKGLRMDRSTAESHVWPPILLLCVSCGARVCQMWPRRRAFAGGEDRATFTFGGAPLRRWCGDGPCVRHVLLFICSFVCGYACVTGTTRTGRRSHRSDKRS